MGFNEVLGSRVDEHGHGDGKVGIDGNGDEDGEAWTHIAVRNLLLPSRFYTTYSLLPSYEPVNKNTTHIK